MFSSHITRSPNHNIFSFEHGKALAFSDCKHSNLKLGYINAAQGAKFRLRKEKYNLLSGDMLHISTFDSYGKQKRNRDFVLMAKSALNVENMVELEGNEVVSRETNKYDAIVIGSGIGGLVAATQLAVKGARVLVLEKYVIPGGSSGYYQRDGYTFDVGSSVMFGFSDKVSVLLII